MRKIDLEAKVLDIIERVEKGQPIEDSLVECKAVWIEPGKAARRLAGHANAARGEPILWLMGVNEKAKAVPGVPAQDLAQWWQEVSACYDGLPPEMQDLNVPHSAVTVVALWFETDRAPFVIRNPKQDAITHEVPWRDGTRVRTATREDLVKLLVPLSQLPTVEPLEFRLTEQQPFLAKATLYFVPQRPDELLCFPFHQMEMTLTSGRTVTRLDQTSASPSTRTRSRANRPLDFENIPLSATVVGTDSELLLRGPGKVIVNALLPDAHWPSKSRSEMLVNIKMGLAGSHRVLNIQFAARSAASAVPGGAARWTVH